MTEPKIWFVCAKRSPSDIACGQPFTGEVGRHLYTKCLKPLGLRRSDVGLWSLDSGDVPFVKGQVIIAVGRPAFNALGDRANVTIPHPAAVIASRDTGETLRKIERVASLLKSEEDAQALWAGEWQQYVPPGGGQYVYQKHTRGDTVHYDIRFTSKNSGKSWGWTVVGGKPLGKTEAQTMPKAEHTNDWMEKDGELPNGDTMEIVAKGDYSFGLCHDSMCELLLKDLTNPEQQSRVLIVSSETNESGVRQWVSLIPNDSESVLTRKSLAEITGEMKDSDKLIASGELLTAGTVQKRMQARIVKSENSKHIVYGVVLDPYIVDAHDDWTPPAEVEKAAHDYLRKSRVAGYMHERQDEDSHIVESWLVDYPSHEDYIAAMNNEPHKVYARKFGAETVHSGTWMMGMKLGDESWAEYEAGDLNAFSPGGYGSRKKIERQDMPKIEVIDAA